MKIVQSSGIAKKARSKTVLAKGSLGTGLDKGFGNGGIGVSGTGMGGGSSAYGMVTVTSRGVLGGRAAGVQSGYQEINTESYESPDENGWKSAKADPLSTFSVDVDTASYSNIRRFLTNHELPPVDAVRIEEMINYFTYNYPQPSNGDPVKISTELTSCPWKSEHRILKIGIKGKEINLEKAPPSNLVFLVDVSGSMQNYNKLPLLKQSFKLLINNLRKDDLVSIAVYAGSAGTVLEPTPGNEKEKIIAAIENLYAGGSTAGAQGIQLAYKLAEKNFIKGGNNRVVLATDGDFNVGISDDSELVKLIEEEREKGVFLTVLGYGMGNYKDAKMEKLADKGNGNFAYIDNLLEAKKVLVNEMSGTLFTIAKDVKIQIEFNPAAVSGYRLIGYENRMLKKEDFNNDRKDAGEIGAGHTVTAMYEIIPANADVPPIVDELKYQKVEDEEELSPEETATVKVRFKKPDGDKSMLIKKTVKTDSFVDFDKTSADTRFAVSVAAAGMILKKSKEVEKLSWDFVVKEAKNSKGNDEHGYRAEFINLIEKSQLISSVK
ncbi:MAG TPA: VWA domain-containing protein [bacterium]|nr:VWA domain-containing protein [bacterium]